jgi:5'-deoxynucleotidase YfbR-like HD superfamily hydrolase
MRPKKLLWRNRDADLESLIRYYDLNHRFEVMYYRTNLLVHTRRVEAIIETLIPLAQECYEGFDPHLARLISRYHDDPELVAKRGDVSLQLKLKMGDYEKEILKKEEVIAIDKISNCYPKMIDEYCYREILLHALNKDCREAQLHSFADKHDGNCEALHEVLAGNTVFLEPVLNYSSEIFTKRKSKFFLIEEMFDPEMEKQNPFLQFPVLDLMNFFENGKLKTMPHKEESVVRNSQIPYYEKWKELTLNTFPNGLELLTKQKEFQQ